MDKQTRRAKGSGYIRCEGKTKTYYGYLRKGGKVERVKLTQNRRESEALWAKYLTKTGTLKPSATYGRKTPLQTAIDVAAHRMEMAQESPVKIRQYKMFFGWLRDNSTAAYLEDVTPEEVSATLSKHGGASQKNRIVSVLRNIYKHNGVDGSKVLDVFHRFHDKVEHHAAFTEEEVCKLLALSGGEWDADFHDLVILGVNTGLRLKDAVNLHKSQIINGYIKATPFKTRMTVGTECNIPLNGELRGMMERREKGGLCEDGLYFPKLAKEYAEHQSRLSISLRKFFERAGISGRSKKFHALRTTYITRLVAKGVPLGIIQTVVGHLDPATTMVYVRPNEDMMMKWFGE